jgi:hypothetical protein
MKKQKASDTEACVAEPLQSDTVRLVTAMGISFKIKSV